MVINLCLLHMDKTIVAVLTDKLMITVLLMVLLSVPFILFQNKMSTWLSSVVEKADNKKEEKANAMSQNMYTLLMLLHAPVFFSTVLSSPYVIVYGLAYLIAGSAMLMVDPWGLISMNKFSNTAFVGATILAFATLITQSYSLIKLACIITLCVSFTNIIREYTDNKGTLVYFLLYTIPYCIAYLFALQPSLVQVIRDKLNEPGASEPIRMNVPLFLCVLFFVLLFYSSTMFQNYYGKVLIREPVKLSIPTELRIDPSYDYTLSYCVYMDAVPPEYNYATTLHSNVVSCGYGVQTKYEPSSQTLRVVTKQPTSDIFETEFLPQRWNHVVLVSHKGQLDIYLNGDLVGTKHSLSPTEKYMLVGQQNGLKGKICCVIYSKVAMSNVMVNQLYLQLKSQDPPMI